MFKLHLRNSDSEVEVRSLGSTIVLGRDESADWSVPDADNGISRRHVELTPAGKHVLLKALGKSGVTLSPHDTQIAAGQKALIGDGEGFAFGNYSVLVRKQANARDEQTTFNGAPVELLDAFLEGAGIDPSIFAVEEPVAIMRRAGAIYMEAIRGFCDLTDDRHRLKQSLAIDQTTVSAGENNPLRWAGPHRVAIDLLRGGEVGFLSGPDAIKAAANDIRRHLQAFRAGCKAAIEATIERVSPEQLAKRAMGGLPFVGGNARRWKALEEAHGTLVTEVVDTDLPMRRAFAVGYEKSLTLSEKRARDDVIVPVP